jgi:PBSX family phage terminase large subunit
VNQIDLSDIESIEIININTVYDLTVSQNSNYYISAGKPILVHNSGKTWSSVDFVILLASIPKARFTINIIKETYNSFKTTLYEDFDRRLSMFGLQSPFDGIKEVSSFWLMGSKVNLLGADKASTKHGVGADFVWFNESLDIQKSVFDQSEMRCRHFWWMDYNPKVTDHWVYDQVCERDNVAFLKTTFLDNPFISPAEKNKILSYEDTPRNRANGTVDKYMWDVYGLGLRSARVGLIFPQVTWIDKFPENQDHVVYGMDFGYTNHPSAIGRVCLIGNDLFLEKLLYQPTEDFSVLQPYYEALVGKEPHCWADSADPGMIADFRRMGYNVFGVSKPKGSVKWGIDMMKRYNIHIVRSPEARKEQENYCWKEINGILLNEPEDKFNHLWDCWRYAVMSEYRN